MPSTPAPISTGICATPGCGKRLRARGFCVACYYRQLRHGDLTAGTPTRRWRHRLSEVDPVARTATCTTCGPTTIRRRGRAGDQAASWRCIHPGLNEGSRLYKAAMRASKRSVMARECEVCGWPKDLRWDHDHATGEYRGTLCNTCNTAIGMMYDDPERLRAAARYLEADRQRV